MAEEKSMPQRPGTPTSVSGSAGDSDVQAELQSLRAELKAMRGAMPLSLIPLHGGGPGEEVAETWSLADQEAAKAEA